MNTPTKISAVKPRRPHRSTAEQGRGGENVHWKRIQAGGDDLVRALRVSPELQSGITRLVLYKHLTKLQGEAAKRYAYIMARFDKYHAEGRRSARSPSYERAFGQDQELERLAFVGEMDDYEKRAKKARRQYDKLQKVLAQFAEADTGRNKAKDVLDDLCCSDIEPATEYRQNVAIVLSAVAKAFGVTDSPRNRYQKRHRRPRKRSQSV